MKSEMMFFLPGNIFLWNGSQNGFSLNNAQADIISVFIHRVPQWAVRCSHLYRLKGDPNIQAWKSVWEYRVWCVGFSSSHAFSENRTQEQDLFDSVNDPNNHLSQSRFCLRLLLMKKEWRSLEIGFFDEVMS